MSSYWFGFFVGLGCGMLLAAALTIFVDLVRG